ncbi:hypothetical protein Bca101_052051 [Brassica carinata]
MATSSEEANLLGKRKPEDGLGTEPVLKKHKEKSEEKEIEARVELLLSDDKSTTLLSPATVFASSPMASSSEKANLLGKRKLEDGLGTDPVLKKHKEKSEEKEIEARVELLLSDEKATTTLLSSLLVIMVRRQRKDPLLLCFFQNVGQVVRVRLVVDNRGVFMGDAFVEFASTDQANKALKEKKCDKFNNWRKIVLGVADKGEGAPFFPPKYLEDEEDYLQQEVEEDEDYLQQEVEEDEDYLQQESLPIVEDETPPNTEALKKKNGEYLHDHEILLMKRLEVDTPHSAEVSLIIHQNIINFFKDVGEVVHVRLMVGKGTGLMGSGYVEFASAAEAEKAMEKKNGKYLNRRKLYLSFVKEPSRFKFEDYVQRENLLLQENASMEGLDETPDFVEAMRINQHVKGIFVKMLEIAPYPFRPKYEDELRREGFGLPTRPKPEKEPCVVRKITFCGQRITFSDED